MNPTPAKAPKKCLSLSQRPKVSLTWVIKLVNPGGIISAIVLVNGT